MVAVTRGVTIVRQEIEFPTEWTMVEDGANVWEQPQEEKMDSEESSEKVKPLLVTQVCGTTVAMNAQIAVDSVSPVGGC